MVIRNRNVSLAGSFPSRYIVCINQRAKSKAAAKSSLRKKKIGRYNIQVYTRTNQRQCVQSETLSSRTFSFVMCARGGRMRVGDFVGASKKTKKKKKIRHTPVPCIQSRIWFSTNFSALFVNTSRQSQFQLGDSRFLDDKEYTNCIEIDNLDILLRD